MTGDFFVSKNGNFPSLKALVESGMAVGGVTDGKTSVTYMVDTFTGEVYPADAKEKLAQWYEEFWNDLGRKQDESVCNSTQDNRPTDATNETRKGLQPLEPT